METSWWQWICNFMDIREKENLCCKLFRQFSMFVVNFTGTIHFFHTFWLWIIQTNFRNDQLSSLLLTVKNQQFSDSFKVSTFFVEKINNQIENVFIHDTGNNLKTFLQIYLKTTLLQFWRKVVLWKVKI